MRCVHEACMGELHRASLAYNKLYYGSEVEIQHAILSLFFLLLSHTTILTSFLKFNFVPVSCVTDEVAGVIVQPTVG